MNGPSCRQRHQKPKVGGQGASGQPRAQCAAMIGNLQPKPRQATTIPKNTPPPCPALPCPTGQHTLPTISPQAMDQITPPALTTRVSGATAPGTSTPLIHACRGANSQRVPCNQVVCIPQMQLAMPMQGGMPVLGWRSDDADHSLCCPAAQVHHSRAQAQPAPGAPTRI